MANLWRNYLTLLKNYPLRTMCSTTGTLMFAGDTISQLVIEKHPLKEYSFVRSGRFFIMGFCVLGPIMRYWYLALDRMYACKKYSTLKMVLTDQLVGSPFVLFVIISGMDILRGKNVSQIREDLRRDYLMILINSYKIWPAAQAINFFFLPLQHRVLFVNFVALGWNTYLAWATERKVQRPKPAKI